MLAVAACTNARGATRRISAVVILPTPARRYVDSSVKWTLLFMPGCPFLRVSKRVEAHQHIAGFPGSGRRSAAAVASRAPPTWLARKGSGEHAETAVGQFGNRQPPVETAPCVPRFPPRSQPALT